MSTAMVPHPPLGWSHHTTHDHLVSVDGDKASIDTQLITFHPLAAQAKPRAPGRSGACWTQRVYNFQQSLLIARLPLRGSKRGIRADRHSTGRLSQAWRHLDSSAVDTSVARSPVWRSTPA